MSYTVLARRYRSRDFDEIVGQDAIATTLRNAIDSDRIAHAYLFCGTRGVGKTSMARIFAKAINADDDSLAQAEAIGQAIMRGDDLDVIEIDGASNRGVNEARELIAGSSLSPARCRYRIYIIDEVHMLTREAFNALLKTMEEPPAHVKFILCTTEAHKVPATIQSRCQRFDFRPLTTQQIAGQIGQVLASEKITADDEVIAQVARLGAGSMRDALSILDRLIATGCSPITSDIASQTLGLPDRTQITALVDAIIAADPADALGKGAALLDGGTTIEQSLEMLADHFRDLMVFATCGNDTTLVDLSSDARQQACVQAAQFDAQALVHQIAMCDHVASRSRGASTARALFDALLVRLCMSEHLADISQLLRGGGDSGQAAAGKKKAGQRSPSQPTPERVISEALREPLAALPIAPAPAATQPTRSESVPKSAASAVTEIKPEPQSGPTESATGSAAAPIEDDTIAIWSALYEAPLTPPQRSKLNAFEPRSLDGRELTLGMTEAGQARQRYFALQGAAIEQIIQQALGKSLRVRIIEPEDAPGQDAAPQSQQSSERLAAAHDDPHVRAAMELFDAVVTDVSPTTETQH